jgi:hypothetical protein
MDGRTLWVSAAALVAVWFTACVDKLGTATTYGAFGLFPIGWVVFTAILLSHHGPAGKFQLVRDSVSGPPRIAKPAHRFAFGAFVRRRVFELRSRSHRHATSYVLGSAAGVCHLPACAGGVGSISTPIVAQASSRLPWTG